MSRQKRKASHYEQAAARLASLKSIDPKLDLGNGLSVTIYENAIHALQADIETYNTLLSKADELQNMVNQKNKDLRDLSERMLAGVASRFGKNSNEYEMAGGVKKSERKRPVFKKAS
ncbi:MAG: hypothetical protein JNM68_15385 [Dinghuibacter sp.]|nr:hypothetical protein [Dinghuibacter sp.]